MIFLIKVQIYSIYYLIMQTQEIVCKKCACWVDCTKNGETKGFCLQENLFTYTAKTSCQDYIEGTPMTEQEYEDYQYAEA